MSRLRCGLPILGLGLLLAFAVRTDGQPPGGQPPPGFTPPGFPPGGPPLLTPQMQDKLKLTAEQKEKVEKLLKDYEAKQKEAMTKMRGAMEKAQKDGKPEAFRKIGEQMRDMQQSLAKQYTDAEAGLKKLLNEEQKKKYEELKKEARLGPPFFGPGGPPSPGGPPFGAGPFRPFPGQVLPPPIQDMLRLTPEQKAKIDKLQKEAETKIMEVLTEEQKKQLEEMKRRLEPNAPPRK